MTGDHIQEAGGGSHEGRSGARSGWTSWVAASSALAIVAGATTLLANPESPPDRAIVQSASPTTRAVRVAEVSVGDDERAWHFYGVIRSARRATLSFTLGGRLLARPVEVGMRVERGQLLARLDQRPLIHSREATQATLAELDARLAQQQRDRARTASLFEAQAVALSELEAVDSGLEALRASRQATGARLAEARRVVGEAVLRADFAGEIVEVFLEPGEYARPGEPVLSISGGEELEVQVEVPEAAVLALREDTRVEVSLPLLEDQRMAGKIVSIGDAAPERGGLFPVLVRLEADDGARPGMTAALMVETRNRQVKRVPVAAVVDPSGERPGVFVVESGKVRRVPVRLGAVDGPSVIVKGELSAGERVVVAGHQYLLDGDPVDVRS